MFLVLPVRGQSRARDERAGRERPHELFGRLKAEKVGSLPPDLVFSQRGFSFHLISISGYFKKLLAPQGEETGEGGHAERFIRILHRA